MARYFGGPICRPWPCIQAAKIWCLATQSIEIVRANVASRKNDLGLGHAGTPKFCALRHGAAAARRWGNIARHRVECRVLKKRDGAGPLDLHDSSL